MISFNETSDNNQESQDTEPLSDGASKLLSLFDIGNTTTSVSNAKDDTTTTTITTPMTASPISTAFSNHGNFHVTMPIPNPSKPSSTVPPESAHAHAHADSMKPPMELETNETSSLLHPSSSLSVPSSSSQDSSLLSTLFHPHPKPYITSVPPVDSTHLETTTTTTTTPASVSMSTPIQPWNFSSFSFPSWTFTFHNNPLSSSSIPIPPLPSRQTILSTLIGSLTMLFYHIVYAMTLSSAVSAPHSAKYSSSSSSTETSLLCPIAKMASLAPMLVGPFLIHQFSRELPSLYPCADIFLVPFFAQLAYIIQDCITSTETENQDILFLNTLALLSGMGMIFSGILCHLATHFKLANLGGFLPHAVLCGFFSSVGILCWTLAFSVDNNGLTLSQLTRHNVLHAMIHHIPSLALGSLMFIYGSKNSVYIIYLVCVSILLVYLIMFLTGTTLLDAQESGWFWEQRDFASHTLYTTSSITNNNNNNDLIHTTTLWQNMVQILDIHHYYPPRPFSNIVSLCSRKFHFRAIQKGLPTACAMALIYTIRCFLHAMALKRNKNNLLAILEANRTKQMVGNGAGGLSLSLKSLEGLSFREREDTYDLENDDNDEDDKDDKDDVEIEYKKHRVDVLKVLQWYGNAHCLAALVGGFVCMPSFGPATTLTRLGAEKTIPQYGAAILLMCFYLTNFKYVQYIPKMAFSSLLVLSFFDFIHIWFIKSYKMTKDKFEWMVAPLIIFSSFAVGMLTSVALGVAISTFIFVASFYKTGVVKFIDTGLLVRSTIERSVQDAEWLDRNGDLIQVMVLQNYLFFGNSSSCLNYISGMFEDMVVPEGADFDLPPIPKYLIIDFSLCSGMDTSAVSVFAEVMTICKPYECKVIFAGLPPNLKDMMKYGGIKPKQRQRQGKGPKQRQRLASLQGDKSFAFSMDLESALGDAEDGLLTNIFHLAETQELGRTTGSTSGVRNRRGRNGPMMMEDGFLYALRQIDEQHGTAFEFSLRELSKYSMPIELRNGEKLFEHEKNDGIISKFERGLFFIEHGLMKVERDPSYTLSRSANSMNNMSKYLFSGSRPSSHMNSIGGGSGHGSIHLNHSKMTLGQYSSNHSQSRYGNHRSSSRRSHTFRLARIGPGWVIGGIDRSSGSRNPGIYTAVSHCRLHHLPHTIIKQIEEENPALGLNLFKMLSHLMSRRQDVTIEQLATLHSIITNPPLKKPISRVTMGALQRAHDITGQ